MSSPTSTDETILASAVALPTAERGAFLEQACGADHGLRARLELLLLIRAEPAKPRVRPREIFGWCSFDIANSAFTTIIITVVYARYFTHVIAADDPRATGWWGTTLSLSQAIVIVLSPLLGAVADIAARKKTLLMMTAMACSIATAALYFVAAGEIWLALSIVCVANIAFSLSENLCSAFLPEISTPQNVERFPDTAGASGISAACSASCWRF